MRRAFTLIELLVVIVIIGILVALLMPAMDRIQRGARCAATQGRIRALEQALRSYHDDNTVYPVENNSSDPTVSFLCQLQKMGLNFPYVRDLKGQDLVSSILPDTPTLASDVKVKDPWYSTSKQNHIHYRRGPQRSDSYTSEAAYKAALGQFFGNDETFNLWSFGPNRSDDSSDQATGAFAKAATGGSGGDEGADPKATDGIGDDLTNWNPNSSSASKQ